MGFAVLHLDKAHGSDSKMSDHIERKTTPKNADPTRTHLNRELIEFPGGVTNRNEAISHRLKSAGLTRKIGTNQVRAIRFILSGSPKDMKQIEQAGKLDEWCRDSVEWMKRTYGSENVVSAVLHMDEETPHIHATLIPIVQTERRKKKSEKLVKKNYRKKPSGAARLSANDIMTRHKLKAYQDGYALAMAKYGLKRGIVGSEARHTTTAQYYRDLKRQTGELEANVQQLQTERQQAEQKLDEVKKGIMSEKLEAAKTEAKAALVAKVGSLLGGGKLKAEREGFQQRITELENQNARLEQHIKQMEREHQAQCSKFGEYIDKVKRYFPHVDKLLPMIDFCRNTLHFSEQIIQELCKLKKVKLKGDFYSPEFNRKFHAEGAVFSFEKDKNRTGYFQICVNDIPLVQWFRQKAHEWRNSLGLTTQKQGNGMKI